MAAATVSLCAYRDQRLALSAGATVAMQDPHGDWGAEERRRRSALEAPVPATAPQKSGAEQDAADALELAEIDALMDQIASTPASTLPGACEQVRIALHAAETWEGDRNDLVVTALRNALASLDQIARRTVTDPHMEWAEAYLIRRDRYNRGDYPGADDEATAYAEWEANVAEFDRVLDTPPRTAEGVTAQLLLLVGASYEGVEYPSEVTGPVLEAAAKLLPVKGWGGPLKYGD